MYEQYDLIIGFGKFTAIWIVNYSSSLEVFCWYYKIIKVWLFLIGSFVYLFLLEEHFLPVPVTGHFLLVDVEPIRRHIQVYINYCFHFLMY